MTQLRTAVAARLPIKSALGYMVPNDQPPKKVLRSKFCKELFFLKRFFFICYTGIILSISLTMSVFGRFNGRGLGPR